MNSYEVETGYNQIEKLKKILSEMPSEDIIKEKAEINKALADPTRIKIVYLLKNDEFCTGEISKVLEITQPTISHHIKILKKARLLKWDKQGVWVHYTLSENCKKYLKIILQD